MISQEYRYLLAGLTVLAFLWLIFSYITSISKQLERATHSRNIRLNTLNGPVSMDIGVFNFLVSKIKNTISILKTKKIYSEKARKLVEEAREELAEHIKNSDTYCERQEWGLKAETNEILKNTDRIKLLGEMSDVDDGDKSLQILLTELEIDLDFLLHLMRRAECNKRYDFRSLDRAMILLNSELKESYKEEEGFEDYVPLSVMASRITYRTRSDVASSVESEEREGFTVENIPFNNTFDADIIDCRTIGTNPPPLLPLSTSVRHSALEDTIYRVWDDSSKPKECAIVKNIEEMPDLGYVRDDILNPY